MAVALPMESNPETMSRYLHKLGVSERWTMVDVIGLEDEALQWVPRPVLAVILLFPLSDAYEEHLEQQENEMQNKQQETAPGLFHLRQVLSNVCGTVALVHSIANNTAEIELSDGLLKNYISEAQDMDSSGKGALLEKTAAILDAYKEIAASTEGADDNEVVKNHFVTFVHKGGQLYELDGRKSGPVCHGTTTAETLLQDAARVCRDFIAREPDNIGFNIVALVPASN